MYRNPLLLDYVLHEAVARLPANAELLLVDDDAGAEARAVLRRFRRAKVIRHDKHRGITTALNTGARAATGDVLVFMNSDVILGDNALVSLARNVHEGGNEVGTIGALLLYPQDGRVQHAGVAVDKWAATHLFVGARGDTTDLKPMEERQATTGALLACSRSVYEQLGGFDESFRDGLEDVDFCLRCAAQGLKNYISAEAVSYHFESATRGPYKHIRRTYNYAVFFSRWQGRLREDLTAYLAGRLRSLATSGGLRESAVFVNFCSTPNWLDLADTVRAYGVEPIAVHDLSGFVAESEAIDLYRAAPRFLRDQSTPICFVVDHFLQLADNHHWMTCRPNDLIVDRHANAIRTAELQENGQRRWGA